MFSNQLLKMKKLSASLEKKKRIQSKTKQECHFLIVQLAKILKIILFDTGKSEVRYTHSCTACGNVNWYHPLEKQFVKICQVLEMFQPFGSVYLPSRIYCKENNLKFGIMIYAQRRLSSYIGNKLKVKRMQ